MELTDSLLIASSGMRAQSERMRVVAENIATLPNVVGVNNHMGSRFTQLPRKMDQALGVIRSNKLFFVDSLTTERSTAFARARQMGLGAMRRDLFLDTQRDADAGSPAGADGNRKAKKRNKIASPRASRYGARPSGEVAERSKALAWKASVR